MQSYLGDVWKCRYFWLSLAQMDLRARYRRSVLGIGWSLLHPIAMTAVLCTIFHKLFNLDPVEYAPSLLIGLCFWNYITTICIQGCQCLFQGEKYIRQYPAPIAIYPLRTMLGASFHFLMALAVGILLRWSLKGFDNLPALISLVPTLLLMFVLGWSLAVLTGFATAYFPDTHQLSEVALQILFYGTPIMYPAKMLYDKGLAWIVDYNPLAAFVQLLRDPIMAGEFPSVTTFSVAGLTVLIVTGMAVTTLVRLQQKIIFQL